MQTTEKTDTYYFDESKKAIDAAVAEALEKNLGPKETRFLIRRCYPFGPKRKGRPYKIWNRLVLETEARLGLPQRKHKKRHEKAGEENQGEEDRAGAESIQTDIVRASASCFLRGNIC